MRPASLASWRSGAHRRAPRPGVLLGLGPAPGADSSATRCRRACAGRRDRGGRAGRRFEGSKPMREPTWAPMPCERPSSRSRPGRRCATSDRHSSCRLPRRWAAPGASSRGGLRGGFHADPRADLRPPHRQRDGDREPARGRVACRPSLRRSPRRCPATNGPHRPPSRPAYFGRAHGLLRHAGAAPRAPVAASRPRDR